MSNRIKEGNLKRKEADELILTLNARFKHIKDNEIKVFSDMHTFSYRKLRRYLSVFKKVGLILRSELANYNNLCENIYKVSGEGIEPYIIPYFSGPWEFAIKYLKIRRQIKGILNKNNSAALIVRLPCPIGLIAISVIKMDRPYGVEIIGDPWDVFAPRSVKHILRPFLRLYFSYNLKKACKKAVAVLYVTKESLQKRYLCPHAMFSASNIELYKDEIYEKPRKFPRDSIVHIIFVGTMNQIYKAPDILLKAFKICSDTRHDLYLTMLGDGKYRPALEKMAIRLGISEKVRFLGMVSREEVFKKLDESDLFVLPSKTEGLPRAMLEAMARGLPCIGTTVGGIPELLPHEDLVPPGDVKALATKIMEVINDPERMNKMSERNLAKAKEYREDILLKEREAFYSFVKKKTEEWLMRSKG